MPETVMELNKELGVHPAAALFPMIEGKALADFTDDIRAHGLIEPIVLYQGAILDGRNRYAACKAAGVAPRFETWDGAAGSPTLYVISKNLMRRELTSSQRAMIGVSMLPLLQEEAKGRQAVSGPGFLGAKPLRMRSSEVVSNPESGRSRWLAGQAVGVAGEIIWRASVILAKDPAAADRIKHGQSTVSREFKRINYGPDRAFYATIAAPPLNPAPARVPAPAPAPAPARATPPKGRGNGLAALGTPRRVVLDNAMKQRVVAALSEMRGMVHGLLELNREVLTTCLTNQEKAIWIDTCNHNAAKLRQFAGILKTLMTE